MTDEMKKALEAFFLNLLNGAQKWGEKGIDFAAEQIPLVLQEKLWFDAGVAIMWLIVGVTLFPTSVWFGRRFHYDSEGTSWILGVSGVVISVAVVLVNTHTLLNIWLAPRLYIIEWLRTLVKGANQ